MDKEEILEPLFVDVGVLEKRFEEYVDRASEVNEIVITKQDNPIAKARAFSLSVWASLPDLYPCSSA